ncbi:hypothetical protein [Limimaricola sp. AA108-03]|uniref:hypothetical protein n=1 Tax=Limimaricola sp. AA108-03 TaxID=3425945 RepID=UPI003D77B9D0
MGVTQGELASNVARHGALTTEEGRISLTWDRAGDRVTLGWHEIGGTGAPDGAVDGYGLDLVAAQVEDPTAWKDGSGLLARRPRVRAELFLGALNYFKWQVAPDSEARFSLPAIAETHSFFMRPLEVRRICDVPNRSKRFA